MQRISPVAGSIATMAPSFPFSRRSARAAPPAPRQQPVLHSFHTPADISDLPVADQYWVYDYFRQTAVILHRDERYENHIQADGYEWFVLLPYVSSTACLGLIDKYVGAYAVETLCETEDTTTAVIHESGTIGWLSEQKPKQVWINGKDVSDKVEKREMLYTIKLPEASSKIVILIVFL